MIERERINNTRKEAPRRKRPAAKPKPVPAPISLNGYTQAPDENGFFYRCLIPNSFNCTQVDIHLEASDGGQVELGVDNTEFVRATVKGGLNTIQVNRVVPAGAIIRIKFIEGSAAGCYVAMKGTLSA